MWLINTSTMKLTQFASHDLVPEYAILSHVWRKDNGGETSFQDYERTMGIAPIPPPALRTRPSLKMPPVPASGLLTAPLLSPIASESAPSSAITTLRPPASPQHDRGPKSRLRERWRHLASSILCSSSDQEGLDMPVILYVSEDKTSEVPSDQRDTLRAESATLPSGFDKIRAFCALAKRFGYAWAWMDTCCIDKQSSAELSEAINSMFTWYAHAALCIAYLEDVSDTDDPRKRQSEFRKSKWFRRGWTLQELLAPRTVLFFSRGWKDLGTKASLADVISQVTDIQWEVLTLEIPLHQPSVARRMAWASQRETTRVEDRAYCLMGIFGVNMPTIYGEGRRAFHRLQEEILKNSPDESLFAWHGSPNAKPGELLADGPDAFRFSRTMKGLAPEDIPDAVQEIRCHFGYPGQPPTFPPRTPILTMTSRGIEAFLPLIRGKTSRNAVAVLACRRHDSSHKSWPVGLVLQHATLSKELFHYRTITVKRRVQRQPGEQDSRLFVFDGEISGAETRSTLGFAPDEPLRVGWMTFYIVRPESPAKEKQAWAPAYFAPVIPPYVLERIGQFGFELDDDSRRKTGNFAKLPVTRPAGAEASDGPRRGGSDDTYYIVFTHRWAPSEQFRITLSPSLNRGDKRKAKYWFLASVDIGSAQQPLMAHGAVPYALSEVSGWAGRTQVFGDGARGVRLTFHHDRRHSKDARTGEDTTVDVELEGARYQELKRLNGVALERRRRDAALAERSSSRLLSFIRHSPLPSPAPSPYFIRVAANGTQRAEDGVPELRREEVASGPRATDVEAPREARRSARGRGRGVGLRGRKSLWGRGWQEIFERDLR